MRAGAEAVDYFDERVADIFDIIVPFFSRMLFQREE